MELTQGAVNNSLYLTPANKKLRNRSPRASNARCIAPRVVHRRWPIGGRKRF